MNLTYGDHFGIASNATESAWPALWNKLVGLWDPGVGVQGGRLWDYSNRRGHQVYASGANYRWADGGPRGRSVWTNGGSNDYTVGATGLLKGVPQFTMMGWFNQHIIDSTNGIFDRTGGGGGEWVAIETFNDGNLYVEPRDGDFGYFDYSTVITAQSWFHFCTVFDGTQSTDAGKLKIYINGRSITLSYTGVLPSTTPNIDGTVRIGRYATNNQWLGRYTDIRLYHRALTPVEVMESQFVSPLQPATPLFGRAPSVAAAASLLYGHFKTYHNLLVR
jgi:hypothetical protein